MSATADDKSPRLWRSLAELAGRPAFRAFVEAEFPSLAAEGWQAFSPDLDRRRLLKLVGAAAAFGGLAACSPAGKIVPYVRQPEEMIPGKPRYFATTLASQGWGMGVIVESHEGRPTKIEGNPGHPASLGGTDAVMQAAVLDLFDPDRSRTPLSAGEPASYDSFLGEIAALRPGLARAGGKGLAILGEETTSPTLAGQIAALRKAFPEMRLYRHDALAGGAVDKATAALFGRPLLPVLDLGKADIVVSLDADFLAEGPGRLAYARGFADRRRAPRPGAPLNRLYAVETTPTITGAAADHRFAVRPSAVDGIAEALYAAVTGGAPSPDAPPWIAAAAADLKVAGKNALVIAGEHATPYAAGAALAVNDRLGAVGTTLRFIEPPAAPQPDGDLAALARSALVGGVETLIILGCNPLHTAPADVAVAQAFARIPRIVHLGLYRDETAAAAHWHIPAAHDLESWSDLRAFDGTASIVQPLIEPLFGGRTAHEVLAALAGEQDRSVLDLVRGQWQGTGLDDAKWREALKAGVVAGTAASTVTAAFPGDLRGLKPQPPAKPGLEIRFVPDPWLRDGRHANNAWLQELPRPMSKLVWSNAALLAPATAERLGLANGARIGIRDGEREIEAPVWIALGHPPEAITLSFGFSRRTAGPVAALAGGYDAFRLRRSDAPWAAEGVAVRPLGGTAHLVSLQDHHSMEGRPLARHASWAQYRDDPLFVKHAAPPEPTESLYPDWPYPEEAWGMAIDENACIGCMACVQACQAENNIATVGPDECARGHEMHWLRVDLYYEGTPDDPDAYFQPVPCMHCEKAPCEAVCPVNATVHTHDGLNAQVYNRCIGTRYCSQNCPYKVRRFNFLTYQEFDKEKADTLVAVHNPNVSVRSRGVMEKCTYCVQRISAARIHAQIGNRAIADGEVVTACQQACPTRAISFGNLNDKRAAVRGLKQSPLNYALLAELNTRPRTTYLGKVSNPNPDVARDGEAGGRDGTG